jgi:hypothetical protein
MRHIALTLFACVAVVPVGAVRAQQRVVVVPAGAEVAVPARGAPGPRLVNAPRPRIPSRNAASRSNPDARPTLGSGGPLGGSDLAMSALVVLPIAAIAAVAAAIPGGGSSTSAPARTR